MMIKKEGVFIFCLCFNTKDNAVPYDDATSIPTNERW